MLEIVEYDSGFVEATIEPMLGALGEEHPEAGRKAGTHQAVEVGQGAPDPGLPAREGDAARATGGAGGTKAGGQLEDFGKTGVEQEGLSERGMNVEGFSGLQAFGEVSDCAGVVLVGLAERVPRRPDEDFAEGQEAE